MSLTTYFQLSYRSYWHNTIVETILKKIKSDNPFYDESKEANGDDIDTKATISITDLCEMTSIKKEDVISTLQVSSFLLFLINFQNFQLNEMYSYRRGENVIRLSNEMIDAFNRTRKNRQLRIDPKAIKFTPRDWSRKK